MLIRVAICKGILEEVATRNSAQDIEYALLVCAMMPRTIQTSKRGTPCLHTTPGSSHRRAKAPLLKNRFLNFQVTFQPEAGNANPRQNLAAYQQRINKEEQGKDTSVQK